MSLLEFKWTVSRGRDTDGYNICSLYVDGRKVASCNGGGYDMKGTALGNWIAKAYADRLRKLRLSKFPEQSHWERADPVPYICRSIDCVLKNKKPPVYPAGTTVCPVCGGDVSQDWRAGKRVNDGRGFYGLSFHDPDFDPGKVKVPHAPCFGKDEDAGKTVEALEKEGKSLGLERYQAFYSGSAKTPSKRHRIPLIDGGCGFSSVEKIAETIGLRLEYVPVRSKSLTIYKLHDKRVKKYA